MVTLAEVGDDSGGNGGASACGDKGIFGVFPKLQVSS